MTWTLPPLITDAFLRPRLHEDDIFFKNPPYSETLSGGKKRLHEALFKSTHIYTKTLEITVSVTQGCVVPANFIAAAKKVTVMQQYDRMK